MQQNNNKNNQSEAKPKEFTIPTQKRNAHKFSSMTSAGSTSQQPKHDRGLTVIPHKSCFMDIVSD